MKFSIGDPVYIKSNDEEGIIDEFIGIDMVSVMVQKKSYHVFLDDLEHPYLRWFMKQSAGKGLVNTQNKDIKSIDQISKEKSRKRQTVLPHGIYLVFMPMYILDEFDEKVEKIRIYFYNETLCEYDASYTCKIQQELIFTLDHTLHAESEFYIHDLSFDLMAQSPCFTFRFTNPKDDKLDYDSSIIIKPKKLFEQIDKIKYANQAFFHILLIDKILPRKREEVWVKHIPPSSSKKNSINENHFSFEKALQDRTYEVDLHIEKLLPQIKGMGPSEILHLQLKECQRALDLAIATHQSSIILIHGIGKGVLKREIISLLNQTNHILKYVNDYDIRYGYGATEVFFQY